MNTVPNWRPAGDWFDICSCNVPCPCEFAQSPTNNACQGILAWHVREGHLGEVRIPRPRNSPGIAAKLAGHLDIKFGRHPEGAPLCADLGWKRRYAPSRAGSCCRRGLPNGRSRREART
jgi:hypothetical protein